MKGGVILNYTTEVSVEKSHAEVMKLLRDFGVYNIGTDYDPKTRIPTALSFVLETKIGPRQFQVPARIERVQRILTERYKAGDRRLGPRHTTYEHASRVAWRVLKDWLEAQLAVVKLDLVDAGELFFGQLVAGPRGQTTYQLFEGRALLGPGKEERE